MADTQSTQVDTRAETDAKCPSCGAPIQFNPVDGTLTCAYCGYTEKIPEPGKDESVSEMDFASAENKQNCDWGVKTKTVVCKACAAESVYDALQIADVCPYCGSNQVMEAAQEDTLAPGGVCPFEVTAKQAGEKFSNWIRKKWFTPKKAKESAKPDAFHGVYLPYWTFDAKTASRYRARYGVDRKVKKQNGETETVTDWHNTAGFYQEFIDDELVEATERYDGTLLDRVKPFELEKGKPYKPEYLAGFASERYSVGLGEGWKRAESAIRDHLKDEIEREIKDRCNADHVDDLRVSTRFSGVTYKYLLLPLWLSAFRYKDKTYRFMVNGQTGRVGGRAPVSPLRVAIACAVGVAIVAAIVYFCR